MKYWIGRDINDEICLYDPSAQTPGSTVKVWHERSQSMQERARDRFRLSSVTIKDEMVRAATLAKYLGWKKANSRLHQRAPHCFRCHKGLSTSTNKACSKCKWLVCDDCWACNCDKR